MYILGKSEHLILSSDRSCEEDDHSGTLSSDWIWINPAVG